MLPLILLAASLLPTQQASMDCADTGAQTATAETQPVRGPGGASAVLKVSSADDHSKNSHECWADYQLLITPAQGGSLVTADLTASDADYGRSLSLRLDGFSGDGKRLFGVIAEGGKYRTALLFDYHMVDGSMQVVDLKMQFARLIPAGCSETLDVVGTTEAGAIVLQQTSEKPCGASRRWMVDPTGSNARPLPQGVRVVGLYESKADAR